jgi:colanic acid/amylovoran biosynthesis glycosyltransferase
VQADFSLVSRRFRRFVTTLSSDAAITAAFMELALDPVGRLRVALCVGEWLPASETFIYDQVRHQRRTESLVIARNPTLHARNFPYSAIVHLGHLEQFTYFRYGYAPTVARALREHRSEVIHAHFGLNAALVLPYAERLQIPLVATFHGHDVGGLEPQNSEHGRYRRYQRLAPRLFQYASKLLCASSDLAEQLLKNGAPPEKVHVHHLGVDVRKFAPLGSPTPQALRVLMVGRLVEKKGTADGIRAFAMLAERFSDVGLEIIGDGPLRVDLERLTRELKVAERVTFRGNQSSDEVRRAMQTAALLLTPSYLTSEGDRESGVIVIKEAGAVGLPTVATHHGGIPEIIQDGLTGYLVPERDIAGLCSKMTVLLDSSELRGKLGKAARAHIASHFDSQKRNALLEEILWQVVETSHRKRGTARAA